MKNPNSPFQPKALLWWVAAISLAVSGAVYYFLRTQGQLDVELGQRILVFPLIGVIIAGVCLIVGTASHWFYPK